MILHRREWLLGAAGGLALSLTGATAMAQRAAFARRQGDRL